VRSHPIISALVVDTSSSVGRATRRWTS
jgi:hypothetical protein